MLYLLINFIYCDFLFLSISKDVQLLKNVFQNVFYILFLIFNFYYVDGFMFI